MKWKGYASAENKYAACPSPLPRSPEYDPVRHHPYPGTCATGRLLPSLQSPSWNHGLRLPSCPHGCSHWKTLLYRRSQPCRTSTCHNQDHLHTQTSLVLSHPCTPPLMWHLSQFCHPINALSLANSPSHSHCPTSHQPPHLTVTAATVPATHSWSAPTTSAHNA